MQKSIPLTKPDWYIEACVFAYFVYSCTVLFTFNISEVYIVSFSFPARLWPNALIFAATLGPKAVHSSKLWETVHIYTSNIAYAKYKTLSQHNTNKKNNFFLFNLFATQTVCNQTVSREYKKKIKILQTHWN